MYKIQLDSFGQPINVWVGDEPKKLSKNAKRKAKRYAIKFKKITARAKLEKMIAVLNMSGHNCGIQEDNAKAQK